VGSLERDYLRVTQRERSTMTPARLWQRLQAGSGRRATPDDDGGTMPTI